MMASLRIGALIFAKRRCRACENAEMTVQQVTPELKQWIVAQAQAGHKPEAVLEAMRASGWAADVAVDALEATLTGFLAEHAQAAGLPTPVLVPGPDLSDSPLWLDAGDRRVQVLLTMAQPRVVVFGSLLADEECDEMMALARPRLTGAAYDELVDEFITAAREVFPGVVIQFEDFANHNAFRLLAKYRDRICTFNDDIQGTAAVALAGLVSALRVTGGALAGQRLLFMGAGEAATGIADLAVAAMVADGADPALARRCCWLFDSKGLVVAGRAELAEHKRPYAHEHASQADFLGAVLALKPTAIIGVAATAGTFTKDVIEAMTRLNPRPIVFALSNPTSKSECTAQQAYEWSGGQALFASGSPFDPVTLSQRTHVPRQGNNSYIFPGVGLGAVAVRARRITDAMFLAAARALALQVTPQDLAQGSLYPPLASVRDVSAHIAAAVAAVAFEQGHAGIAKPADLLAHVRACMYDPRYPRYA